MGGKSSSSSSQSSNATDKRIAATDSAVVFQDVTGGLTVNAMDAGAIAAAGEIAKNAIVSQGNLSQAALDTLGTGIDHVFEYLGAQTSAAIKAVTQGQTEALAFADKATQDANARSFDQIAPILLVGSSVVAVAYFWSKK